MACESEKMSYTRSTQRATKATAYSDVPGGFRGVSALALRLFSSRTTSQPLRKINIMTQQYLTLCGSACSNDKKIVYDSERYCFVLSVTVVRNSGKEIHARVALEVYRDSVKAQGQKPADNHPECWR